MPKIDIEGKVCYTCKLYKLKSDFHKSGRRRDGIQKICKGCAKQYRIDHCDKLKEQKRQHYENNAERIRIKNIEYAANHKDQTRENHRLYCLERRKTDKVYKLTVRIRTMLRLALKVKGFRKSKRTMEIIGKDGKELYDHLIDGFMKVYNRLPLEEEKLEIDHIIPLAVGKTEEEVLALNHYTNLRFLLNVDNRKKSDSLDWSYGDVDGGY